jgi:hypothetical protein
MCSIWLKKERHQRHNFALSSLASLQKLYDEYVAAIPPSFDPYRSFSGQNPYAPQQHLPPPPVPTMPAPQPCGISTPPHLSAPSSGMPESSCVIGQLGTAELELNIATALEFYPCILFFKDNHERTSLLSMHTDATQKTAWIKQSRTASIFGEDDESDKTKTKGNHAVNEQCKNLAVANRLALNVPNEQCKN